ncbi:MAG: chitobiase/beta-hexosaminidase C-terminal domain-containing protein [Phycisphaerae bacterium]
MKKREWVMIAVLLGVFSVGAWAAQVTIKAGDDVFVGANDANKNWEASTNMFTSRYFGHSQIYLKFDLSPLIPPTGFSLQVDNVSLQTNGGSEGSLTPTYQDAAWFCDNDSWTETTITWNNQPMAEQTTLGGQLVDPWTYVANSGWTMSATGANFAARVGQEAMGDHFLSLVVNGITPSGGYTGGSIGHYYTDNETNSSYGPQIVVNYTIVRNKVPTPTFTPDGNTYPYPEVGVPQMVTISSIDGATIYYTTDGTVPTQTAGTLYQYPIMIDDISTLQARAWKTDYIPSDVKSTTYVFSMVPWTSSVTLLAGDDVFVSTNEPDHNYVGGANMYTSRMYGHAQIYLKFDLTAVAPQPGYILQVDNVTLRTNGGSVGTLTPTYQDAAWFCDNDSWTETTITWNNQPMAEQTELGGQLVGPWDYYANMGWKMSVWGDNLTARVQQEAIGDHFLSLVVNGITPVGGYISGNYGHYYTDSDFTSTYGPQIVVNYSMTLDPAYLTATPVITPDGGICSVSQQVSISCSTPDSTIYYTTNGIDPTESDDIYSDPFTIDRTTVVKAKAWSSGNAPSIVKASTFTFPVNPSTPPATLTINGDLSDWPAASEWSAPFTYWNGVQLTSTTRARFAWNNAQDVLYVAVTTDENSSQPGGHLVIGMSKDNISSIPINSVDSTQLCFDYDASMPPKNVWIRNECALYGYSGTTTGVDAAFSNTGDNYTYEIAIPLWSDWATGTGLQTLSAGDTIYVYVVMENEFYSGNGTDLSYFGNPNFAGTGFAHAAVLTLVQIPGDVNGDNVVDSADLSIVLAAMDAVPTSGNWDGRADLDSDNEITSTDLSIVLANMP